MWVCSNCKEQLEDQFERCWKCGTDYNGMAPDGDLVKSFERASISENQDLQHKVILTTAPSISGYEIVETVDIITSECAMGINLFGDFFSSITDTFGGRDGVTQDALRKARKFCLKELRKEADLVGANAVIAVDLDYSEFSGKGKSMLFLVASGTAVVVEKRGFSTN